MHISLQISLNIYSLYYIYTGFPCSSVGKESACKQKTQVRLLSWEDFLREGNSNPLQYTRLENPTDRGAWRATYSPWGRKECDMTL